jgi:hypothetical protein
MINMDMPVQIQTTVVELVVSADLMAASQVLVDLVVLKIYLNHSLVEEAVQ